MAPTCEDILQGIIANLKVSHNTYKKHFPDTLKSRRFLLAARQLSSKCKDWNSFKNLSEEARKARLKERPKGVSLHKEWVPWDANKAIAMWDRGRAQSPTVSKLTTDQKVHIIFCGMSRYDDLWEESSHFIYIPIYPDNGPYEKGIMLRFTQSFLEGLERELGRGLVASGEDHYRIHQNVVAMVAAEEYGLATVEFRNMKWVSDMVAIHGFAHHVADISADKVVIYAPWESGLVSDDITQKFYLQMQEATAFHTNVRVYPTREEKDAAGLKITDIRTLQKMAEDPANPTAFSYQPKTCLGYGKCMMADWSTNMVLKRNFSCGSRDVRVVDGSSESSWSLLACTGHKHKSDMTTKGNQKRSNERKNNKNEGRKTKHNKKQNRKEEDEKENDEKCTWFHQEFIENLKKWGEVRVFIIGGRIIFRAYTQPFKGKEDSIHVRPLMESDFSKYSKDEGKWKDKWKELDEYCLYTYRVLMKSSKQNFESAQVGLRLDVGMSEDGCFFGLEPTRWYAADWFSGQLCGRDLTDIAQQYGKAFTEWLHRDI